MDTVLFTNLNYFCSWAMFLVSLSSCVNVSSNLKNCLHIAFSCYTLSALLTTSSRHNKVWVSMYKLNKTSILSCSSRQRRQEGCSSHIIGPCYQINKIELYSSVSFPRLIYICIDTVIFKSSQKITWHMPVVVWPHDLILFIYFFFY